MYHIRISIDRNKYQEAPLVFDASVFTSTGHSLNSQLLNGGMIQDNLFSIMIQLGSLLSQIYKNVSPNVNGFHST